MRLPRWLVIAMLATIGLYVLAAVGWWWLMWPEKSALEQAVQKNGEDKVLDLPTGPDGGSF